MIVDLHYNCDHTVFIAVRLSNLQDHMIMVPDSWHQYCSEYTTVTQLSFSMILRGVAAVNEHSNFLINYAI